VPRTVFLAGLVVVVVVVVFSLPLSAQSAASRNTVERDGQERSAADERISPAAPSASVTASLHPAEPRPASTVEGCERRGSVPDLWVIAVDADLAAAVVRDGGGGALRVLELGSAVEPGVEPACMVDRFVEGAFECSEQVDPERGRSKRTLRFEESERAPSKVLVRVACGPSSPEGGGLAESAAERAVERAVRP